MRGEVKDYEKFFEVIKSISPVPIYTEAIEGDGKGYYDRLQKKIVIKEGMSEVQNVKTLIHEIAHATLHKEMQPKDEKTRNSKEVEAESVAYTVCQHYGIDTFDYSFSYVAGWSGGKEVPELKESLDTIRKTAADMITAIDERYQEMVTDKQQEQTAEVNEKADVDSKVDPIKEDTKKENPVKGEASKMVEKPKKESIKTKLKEGKEKAAKVPVKDQRKGQKKII